MLLSVWKEQNKHIAFAAYITATQISSLVGAVYAGLGNLKLIWLKVEQRLQSLTSLESILASSLALRMRLTIHLSASSGVMLSLSASMLRGGKRRRRGNFSQVNILWGKSSKFPFYCWTHLKKLRGTWITSARWKHWRVNILQNINKVDTEGEKSLLASFLCCVVKKVCFFTTWVTAHTVIKWQSGLFWGRCTWCWYTDESDKRSQRWRDERSQWNPQGKRPKRSHSQEPEGNKRP